MFKILAGKVPTGLTVCKVNGSIKYKIQKQLTIYHNGNNGFRLSTKIDPSPGCLFLLNEERTGNIGEIREDQEVLVDVPAETVALALEAYFKDN